MSYAAVSDMEARYVSRDLVQLTDEEGLAIQSAPILQALSDASNEIDSYIESRFSLPLADPPAILTQIACDIAMYRLNSLRPMRDMEDARNRYKDRVKWLESVRDGKTTMGLGADSKEPLKANPTVLITSSSDLCPGQTPTLSSLFSRGTLRNF